MGTVIRQTLGLGLLCFVFVYNQIFFQCLLPKKSRTQSFCYASIFWSVCLFFITEGLSLFNAVNGKMLFASWSVVIFTEILISIKQKYRIQNVVVQSFQDIKRYWSSLETISKALFVTIIISTIITGILAVITVPNNWDSMTYHLSRIAFWQEHGNVNYYATNIPRQLFSPVFAEYINLHLMSICRGDLYVNLLQTFSGIGDLVLVYSSARALNISRKLSLFAVVLVQGMNIFIAESISTQVDIVASFYFSVLIYLLIDYLCSGKQDHTYVSHWLPIGCLSGLLYITKTNTCISAAVMIMGVLLIDAIVRRRILCQLFRCISIGIPAFVMVAPTFLRNYFYLNDPLASEYMGRIAIGTNNVSMLFINLLKNFGNCIAPPWVNRIYEGLVKRIAGLFLVDVNALEISYTTPYAIRYSYHMDTAGAPFLSALIVLVLILSIVVVILKHNRWAVLNMLLHIQFIIMLMAVRWQPWVTRLLLPSLVPLAISIVYCVTELRESIRARSVSNNFSRAVNIAITFILIITVANSGIAFVYHGRVVWKRLVENRDRFESYFAYSTGNMEIYKSLCDEIDKQGYRSIGLYSGGDSYQYPIIARYMYNGIRVENVMDQEVVNGDSTHFSPDVVVMLERKTDNGTVIFGNQIYHCIYTNPVDESFSLWESYEEE